MCTPCSLYVHVHPCTVELLRMYIRTYTTLQIDYGGLVSPSGLSFVGHTHELFGEIPGAVVCKRVVLDKVISRTAQRYGNVCYINAIYIRSSCMHAHHIVAVLVLSCWRIHQ